MSGSTEQYEAVFVDLVQKSWKMFGEMDHATRVDDIFLGAVISAAVRLGRCLIDLESAAGHAALEEYYAARGSIGPGFDAGNLVDWVSFTALWLRGKAAPQAQRS